ncbi:Cys-tRNA(Pro) deacylase [Shewanella litorisediminis]|uniref:Cys-tRNA(Pro)/Cys-tRNA(Cys) deacylase n=1 Tax=Shewanella litorisediminis TaxID=1173586 RepID=A0ABX7G4P8_9GAMM|nr:Cys-tRNA(Pro) deacylase [Shewanella litorisediminis]MCL2917876.1 Cys-tRNA(Pro) deacylase [Shewanella litorisediminis]QRH02312.1 Cys-tRNA(Pro) deacylase [Shewanella litorisediminis]
MTPAIKQAEKAGIPFEVLEYEHDSRAPSYGMEAADKLGLAPELVFKTLMVALDEKSAPIAVALVPVAQQLNLKLAAKALGQKKLVMANPAAAERSSGYLVGGISPLGQKKPLPTLIDASAESLKQMHVSAGRRGLEIAIAPPSLAGLCRGVFVAIAG